MYKHLYHGTWRRNLPFILENGLIPQASKSSMDAVFLAVDPFTATNYQHMHGASDDEWIVLEVDVAKLEPTNLGPDNCELTDLLSQIEDEDDPCFGADWSDCSWAESLRICGQAAYAGVVPAAALKALPKKI